MRGLPEGIRRKLMINVTKSECLNPITHLVNAIISLKIKYLMRLIYFPAFFNQSSKHHYSVMKELNSLRHYPTKSLRPS